jgi:hypothetical protein
MTELRRAASIQEIVEALASGYASAQLQRDAAFAIPHIWRRGLPPGVSFNARGRPWKWYQLDRFPRAELDRSGWPEEELVTALSTGYSCPDIQKLAAYRIVDTIDLFKLFEPQKKPRKLKESLWGAFHSVLVVANKYHEQGARDPIGAAMRDCALLDSISVDKVKRQYRKGFEENRANVAPFVAMVDASIESGESLDDALLWAGKRSFDWWTLFELKALYRHAKKN